MKFKIIILPVFFLLSISCREEKESIDSFTSRVETSNLKDLGHFEISLRSKDGINKNVYVLSKITTVPCRPYALTYNFITNKIERIDERLMKKSQSEIKCTMDNDTIKKIMNEVIELKLSALISDSLGVFYHTTSVEKTNIIARLYNANEDACRIRGSNFERFKENWFYKIE